MIYNELLKYDYFYLCIIRLVDSELLSTMTRRVLEVRRSALRVVRSREYRVVLSLITSLNSILYFLSFLVEPTSTWSSKLQAAAPS